MARHVVSLGKTYVPTVVISRRTQHELNPTQQPINSSIVWFQAHGLGRDSLQDFWRTGNAKQDGYRGFMGDILRGADCEGWLPCRCEFVLGCDRILHLCLQPAVFADRMPCKLPATGGVRRRAILTPLFPRTCTIAMRAVEANAAHFYLSSRLPGHNVPTAEENFWYDISTGVDNASDNPHLLGGSMSFWTDEFS